MIIPASNYSIHIGADALVNLDEFLTEKGYADRKIFIMVDENTFRHCLPLLLSHIEVLQEAEVIEVANGEENKNIDVCIQVWHMLTEKRATRRDLLINLGGGVIADMGGFIASTFKRGMSFINVPTTLLSQVDASVGGKVGVDFNGIKNQVGLFANPKAVFIYPTFLYSLDKRQMLSGHAEIIKHALIADRPYWEKVKETDIDNINLMADLIVRSIQIKNEIVNEDPHETSYRKALNFGHTVGHAIETFSMLKNKLPLLHGEAVAIGMVCEAYISRRVAGLPPTELAEITGFIKSLYPPYTINKSFDDYIIDLMRDDKKVEKGELNFSLLKRIGEVEVNHTADEDLIREALNYYRLEFNDAILLN
jgi:3-dehydroquinate synthase